MATAGSSNGFVPQQQRKPDGPRVPPVQGRGFNIQQSSVRGEAPAPAMMQMQFQHQMVPGGSVLLPNPKPMMPGTVYQYQPGLMGQYIPNMSTRVIQTPISYMQPPAYRSRAPIPLPRQQPQKRERKPLVIVDPNTKTVVQMSAPPPTVPAAATAAAAVVNPPVPPGGHPVPGPYTMPPANVSQPSEQELSSSNSVKEQVRLQVQDVLTRPQTTSPAAIGTTEVNALQLGVNCENPGGLVASPQPDVPITVPIIHSDQVISLPYNTPDQVIPQRGTDLTAETVATTKPLGGPPIMSIAKEFKAKVPVLLPNPKPMMPGTVYRYQPGLYIPIMSTRGIQTPMSYMQPPAYRSRAPIPLPRQQPQKRERKPLVIVDPNTKTVVQMSAPPPTVPAAATAAAAVVNPPVPPGGHPVPGPYTMPPANVSQPSEQELSSSNSVKEQFRLQVQDVLTRPQTTSPAAIGTTEVNALQLGVNCVNPGGLLAAPQPDVPITVPIVHSEQVISLPYNTPDQVIPQGGTDLTAETVATTEPLGGPPMMSIAKEFKAKVGERKALHIVDPNTRTVDQVSAMQSTVPGAAVANRTLPSGRHPVPRPYVMPVVGEVMSSTSPVGMEAKGTVVPEGEREATPTSVIESSKEEDLWKEKKEDLKKSSLPRGHMESTETLPLVGVPTGLDQQKGQRRHMYDREYLLQLRSKLVCQVPPLEILLKECYKKNEPQHSGGSGGGGGRRQGRQREINEPQKTTPRSAAEAERNKSEQPWQRLPAVQLELTEEQKETQEVFRKFQSILNKLTLQNLTELADATLQLKINTEERLKGVIDKIFTKVLEETNFSEVYASLCRVLAQLAVETINAEGKPETITFRRLLVTKCQQEFEKDMQEDEERKTMQKGVETAETEEIRKQRQTALEANEVASGHRSLGNIRFIGELYKLKILTESIMHECMIRLLRSASDEESLECFAMLMTTIGKDLDKEEAKQWIDTCFSRVNDIIKKGKISSRIKCVLQDVVDLRDSQWVPRQRQDTKVKYTGNSCMPSYGRKKMTGGAGGQKRSSEPSSEQPSSKATVAKIAKSIVREFCEIKDLKKAVECVKEMKSPGMLHVFVSEAINYALENTSECRQLVGQLFHQLLQDGTLAMDRMVAGLGAVMKTAEDIEIDVPKIWDYIGELLCPPVVNRTLPLGTLITTFPSNLLTSGKAALLATKLLRQCVVVTSEEVVFQLWSSCKEQHDCLQLRPQDLEGLQFLCECSHSVPLEGLTDRLRSANVVNDKIMDWIESSCTPEECMSPTFIRTLTTAMVQGAVTGKGSNAHYAEELFHQRLVILRNYVNSDENLELEVLLALEMAVAKLDHPPKLLCQMFTAVYDCEMVGENSCYTWRDRAQEGVEGKGTAVMSVKTFFDRLENKSDIELNQPIVGQKQETVFASTHGENIRLADGGQSAHRFKDNSKGVVVASAPIQSDKLFQIEITEMNPEWSGSLSIGVTALPLDQVVSVSKAKKLPGQSFVITASDESTVLYVGGQEMGPLPFDINLKVGDTIGLLRHGSGALHFFLNGVHMVKLPCTVPEGVYGLVDLYGQCVKVTLKPQMPQTIENPRYVMDVKSAHEKEKELLAKAKQLYEEAMKLGSVKMSIIKCLVLGIAGVGKTHLKRLLLSENKGKTVGRVSTGLADNPIQVSVKSIIAGVDDKDQWEILDESKLLQILANAYEMEKPPLPIIAATTNTSPQPVVHQEPSIQPVPQEQIALKVPVETGVDGGISEESTMTLESKPYSNSVAEKVDNLFIDAFKNVADKKISNQKLVHFIDSGGQPQFLELLPAFVQDVSVILFAVNLSEPLDHCPMIYFYGEDSQSVGKPFESPSSHKQVLEQCLKVANARGDRPHVFVVGTHRDKENECPEKIGDKNEMIRRVINSEYLVLKKGTEVIWDINSKSPDTHDHEVAAQLRRAIVAHCPQDMTPSFPIKWFHLELLIRHSAVRGVISFSNCLEQALSLGMDEEGLQAALLRMVKYNLLLWYYKIAALREVVFCDPQVILKIITDLVQYKYQLAGCDVEQKRSSDGVKGVWCEKFRDHAIVSEEFLYAERFKRHFVDGVFTLNNFIKLMCHLFIMVPLEGGSHDYLMPALLNPLNVCAINKQNKIGEAYRILFPNESVPYGMFSSLVAFLQKSEECSLLEQHKKPMCLYRNCVTFKYKKFPAVFTIIDSTAFIEVHLVRSESNMKNSCPKIRKLIYKGIEKCAEVLHYSGWRDLKDGFICSNESCRFVAIPYEEHPDLASCLHCSSDMDLALQHTVWITEEGRLIDQPESSSPGLVEENLVDVLNEVNDLASKWNAMGLALRLCDPDLEIIDSKYRNDPRRCLKEVLQAWLKCKYNVQKFGSPSWKLLCKAVGDKCGGDNPALATKIRDKYRVKEE